jgi:tRNA pseudouridine55 synthase
MDGLLVVDKPSGLTSHEVVAFVRRILRVRRVGHTGTLDPAATGVLVLLLGRATRLAQFLSGDTKTYEATMRLGFATDTYDAQGSPVGARHTGALPARDEVDRALDDFRGTFLQRPPAFSAKKIDGTRSYRMARQAQRARAAGSSVAVETGSPTLPSPARVTAHEIEVLRMDGDLVDIRVTCTAGFYVRSLIHDAGERLGVGAHLTALRRTRSGSLTLADAVSFEKLARAPDEARAGLVPPSGMLTELRSVTLTSEGVAHAINGRPLGPRDTAEIRELTAALRAPAEGPEVLVRMLDPRGELVGIARPSEVSGFLHPSVVLK